jgi:hypothetical protein
MSKEDEEKFLKIGFQKGVDYMDAHNQCVNHSMTTAEYFSKFKREKDSTHLVTAEQSLKRAAEALHRMEKIYVEMYGSISSEEGGASFRFLGEHRSGLKNLGDTLDIYKRQ